jgi:sugar O-acyltransferase (sialic acid O-acetyltransferase NeuD family)
MRKPLILIGGGGHCKSCIDVIEREGIYHIEGILDAVAEPGSKVLHYPVLGNDALIPSLIDRQHYFLITVGQIKSSEVRRKIYEQLVQQKAKLAIVVSPTATVSRYAEIGEGSIIMNDANVNAGSIVGNNVILNSGCLLEHDVVIADHVHVSTHAVLNGEVKIGEGSFVGSNSVLNQEVSIGKNVIIGSGAVVISDLIEPGTYHGVPAKRVNP